ncbi:glycosyltransferase [Candidatus Saccharibacteria bacterium]|nr:glycosyltransferase [Candidatus Saccharibacteria bacterium]MBI3337885.1 glycosyltransferase [Candidatus Saccharibacteria bacterium]
MKKTPKQPDLTILIPAYREEKRIGKTLDELSLFIQKDKILSHINVEVMVVSADSPDKTHEIVQQKAKLFSNFVFVKSGAKVGKGRDVRAGMLRAKGQAVLFMDADLATPLKYIPKFYKTYLEGTDVVAATRNLRRHHPGILRRMLSNFGNLLFRILCGVWIEDSQCGFKLFSKKAQKVCFSKMTIQGWGFDMEVLTIARVNKFKMATFRINDWKSVAGGTFVDNPIKSAFVSLSELLYIFWRRANGKYKI